jgi:hypothetical protein
MVHGLIDRAGPPPPQYLHSFAAFVISASWSLLQPSQGAPLAPNNQIDQGIAAVREMNRTNPGLNMVVKVRVFAGLKAPSWAKQLGGPPVTVTDPSSQRSGTVGRFWTPEFGAAYDDLENKLAAAYDGVSELYEVTISRCMTVYDEPFIRQTNDPASVSALIAAGYTVDADKQCQQEQIDAHKVWKLTRSGLAFNPYQVINADGTTGVDETYTESMMTYCRSALGRRCVLENNSLHLPVATTGAYGSLHVKMKALGPPISLQTAGAISPSALAALVPSAARLVGTDAIEVPQDFSAFAPSDLANNSAPLKANP